MCNVSFDKLWVNVLFICEAGVEPSPLLLPPSVGLFYHPWTYADDCGAIDGMNEWQGEPKYSE
jgi:hypothetical protein